MKVMRHRVCLLDGRDSLRQAPAAFGFVHCPPSRPPSCCHFPFATTDLVGLNVACTERGYLRHENKV